MSNPIIDNIRHSLGRMAQTPIRSRVPIYPPRQPESTDRELERFLNEVKLLSGAAQRIAPAEIAQAFKTLVSECNIHKATFWHTPLFEKLGIQSALLDLGVDLVSPAASKHELALCDLGITEADFLLPETGTIVLRSSAERPRAVSLLPRIHLAIVRPEMLRADMHQVFAEAKDSHYLVFITGPSRTADIELTVTLGVHGPQALHVWGLT
jgi:L-lactate dehydrogenase complex protein LldG